jgi:predicted nucleic-acid-binding protein
VIALDTNLVVRLLTRDDHAQALRARALIEAGAAFVPRTVVLETEWVLRTIYRFERTYDCDRLRGFWPCLRWKSKTARSLPARA